MKKIYGILTLDLACCDTATEIVSQTIVIARSSGTIGAMNHDIACKLTNLCTYTIHFTVIVILVKFITNLNLGNYIIILVLIVG